MSAGDWSVSPAVMAAILFGMAVTYVWRAGGFFLMGFVQPTPRLERALAALPGSIVASIVLPTVARGGWVAAVAIGAALAVRIWRGSDMLALFAGLVVATALRAIH